MADVVLSKPGAYKAPNSTEPVSVMNGTDKVEIVFIDDYSKMGLKVTASGGTETVYEVAIAERT
jgi:hypothetical protein